MQVELMYQQIILDHYRNPHHKGLREPFNAEVHHVNPVCGDEVTLRGTIKNVAGEPVTISQAFLELMQSKGEGSPDEGVLEDAVAFAGVSKYPARIKCALLGWMAWKDATAQALEGYSDSDAR